MQGNCGMRPAVWVCITLLMSFMPKAVPAADKKGEIRRSVLALYDSSDPFGRTVTTCETYNYLQMPLERLGMRVVYHDAARRPLPKLDAFRAVVLWFGDSRLREPGKFCAWLSRGLERGTRLIAVGGLGCETDPDGNPADPDAVKRVLRLMGLERKRDMPEDDNPFAFEIHDFQAGGFGWETRMPPARISANAIIAADRNTRVWRAVMTRDKKEIRGVLVATGPRGGWIHSSQDVLRVFEKPVFSAFWDLDPFAFLEAALGCAQSPRPDVTTAFGCRAAFSHIDGDGMVNLTMDLPGPARPASRVILEEILEKYQVPVCVGLVAARVDPAGVGEKKYLPLWRRIMARPNVQPGCHGYAHPMNWRKGTVGIKVPGYRFSEKLETIGAMETLRRYALPRKERVSIYLWTGDCSPGESAVRLVREYGALNMNGGDPRLDQANNSITHLCPLARAVGNCLQVHTAASNEYIYTDGWTRNYSGFANVIETFKRSGSPLRLLPVNIYYHFYIGERAAGLQSLRRVYDWALSQPLCWIHADEYAAGVNDFYKVRFTRIADNGYEVSDYGACRSVRLDHTQLNIDLRKSRSILGFTHYAGSLYISLAPAARAIFHLTAQPPDRPCLVRSTSRLQQVTGSQRRWSARARLYAPGRLVLRGFPANTRPAVSVGDSRLSCRVDQRGFVTIPLPGAWGRWVEVKVGY